MAKYAELFSISTRHEYFAQAGNLRMVFHLSQTTTKLFINMGVIFKPYDSGCRIFYDETFYENTDNLYTLFSGENIVFILYPEDSQGFYNYTAGFSAKKQGALLFTEDMASKIENGIIDLGVGKFTFYESSEFTLEDVNELRSMSRSQIPIVFKISINSLLNYDVAPNFRLKFNSIETYYKYYFSDNLESMSLQVQDVEKRIKFIRRQEEIENGKTMLVFISTVPIKSQYNSKLNIQLLENNSGNKTIIMNNMPKPKPGSYFTDQVNDEQVMVSEIFIN